MRMRRPRVAITFAVFGLAAFCALVGIQLWTGLGGFASTRAHGSAHHVRTDHGPTDRLVRRRLVICHSAQGRTLTTAALGDPDAPRRLFLPGWHPAGALRRQALTR